MNEMGKKKSACDFSMRIGLHGNTALCFHTTFHLFHRGTSRVQCAAGFHLEMPQAVDKHLKEISAAFMLFIY